MRALADAVARARTVAVITHTSPDGDALGCVLALSRALRALGKRADAYCTDPMPTLYAFAPDARLLLTPDAATEPVDLCVMADAADPLRTGDAALIWESAKERFCLDHHIIIVPPEDARSFIEPTASSCGELVLRVIDELGAPLDVETATLIYIAVSTDTGHFSYPSVNAATYAAASRLTVAGIDVSAVTYELYRRRSRAKTMLLGRGIASLTFSPGGRIAGMRLSAADYAAAGASDEDSEGLINYAVEIDGVQAAYLLREKQGELRCSMRSKGDADVAAVCRAFGGGGHKNAAGCTLRMSMEEGARVMTFALAQALAE